MPSDAISNVLNGFAALSVRDQHEALIKMGVILVKAGDGEFLLAEADLPLACGCCKLPVSVAVGLTYVDRGNFRSYEKHRLAAFGGGSITCDTESAIEAVFPKKGGAS